MSAFTILSDILPRLAALHLASESGSGALSHLALSIRGTTARFIATDGRLLAMIQVPIGTEGVPALPDSDVVLDMAQFTTAIDAMAALKIRNSPVSLVLGQREIRLTLKTSAHLVRVVDVPYPFAGLESVLRRFLSAAWIPTVSAIDPRLLQRIQRITGSKTMVHLRSPINATSTMRLAWNPPNTGKAIGSIPASEIQEAVNAPACWTDGDLLVLAMPVTMPPAQPIDLTPWLPAATAAATQAA